MYHPCVSHGPLSTYQQHVRKLSKVGHFECPRDALLKDITLEMLSWQDSGDHLIVLTNFNDDTTDS